MRVARLVLALAGVASIARADRLAPAPTLDVATDVLPNGLRVIVAPDPGVSSVVVHVRYDGGAAADGEQAGYAHLVELLLGAGTVHTKPGEFDARIDAAGGFASSVTTIDHTSVFEQVPAGALELALFLEAERMAGLAGGIRDDELAKAKEAIAAEYRAAYEDQPYGLVEAEVRRLQGSPNAAGALGSPATVAAATLGTVTAFVRERIVPANATLVIVGRADTKTALALARRYFGWIPRGETLAMASMPAPTPVEAAAQSGGRTLMPRAAASTVVDPVAKVVVAYRAGSVREPSLLQFEIAARMLAGARSSRLARALVAGGLATDVRAEVIRSAAGAELRVTAIAAEGVDLVRLATKVRAEVAGLASLTDEEQHRAALAAERDLVAAIENLAFRADALASWQAYLGEANHLDTELALLRSASTSDLRKIAGLFLADDRAITVIGKPKEAP